MFEFFEIVEVIKADERPGILSQHGYIAGKSYEDGGPIEGYGVFLFGAERVFAFKPEDLKSTGYLLATKINERGHVAPVEIDGGSGS